MLFAAFLIDNELQSSTVKSYLSALRSVLTEDGYKLKEDLFLVSSLTGVCKLKNDTLTVRLPIHKELLRVLLNETCKYFLDKGQKYLEVFYSAILISAYYGMLCIGEVTKSPHVLLAKNVHIGVNKNKIMFVLTTSKTHGQGDLPQIIKISGKTTDTNNMHEKCGTNSNFPKNYCPFN